MHVFIPFFFSGKGFAIVPGTWESPVLVSEVPTWRRPKSQPLTRKVEAGGFQIQSPPWVIEFVQGHPGKFIETLSQNEK